MKKSGAYELQNWIKKSLDKTLKSQGCPYPKNAGIGSAGMNLKQLSIRVNLLGLGTIEFEVLKRKPISQFGFLP